MRIKNIFLIGLLLVLPSVFESKADGCAVLGSCNNCEGQRLAATCGYYCYETSPPITIECNTEVICVDSHCSAYYEDRSSFAECRLQCDAAVANNQREQEPAPPQGGGQGGGDQPLPLPGQVSGDDPCPNGQCGGVSAPRQGGGGQQLPDRPSYVDNLPNPDQRYNQRGIPTSDYDRCFQQQVGGGASYDDASTNCGKESCFGDRAACDEKKRWDDREANVQNCVSSRCSELCDENGEHCQIPAGCNDVHQAIVSCETSRSNAEGAARQQTVQQQAAERERQRNNWNNVCQNDGFCWQQNGLGATRPNPDISPQTGPLRPNNLSAPPLQAGFNQPPTLGKNPAQASMGGYNNAAAAAVAQGDPKETNARTGDPVDPILGALTLDVPIICDPRGTEPFCLGLKYNHKHSNPISLFGPGWSLSAEEAILHDDYTVQQNPRNVKTTISERKYMTATGPLDFLSFNTIKGIPLWGEFGADEDRIRLFDGSSHVFKQGVRPNYDDNKCYEGSEDCPVYLIDNHPSTLSQFNPLGSYLVVAAVPSGGRNVYQEILIPADRKDGEQRTSWLQKIENGAGRKLVEIERAVSWNGSFDFPGKATCQYSGPESWKEVTYVECIRQATYVNGLAVVSNEGSHPPVPYPYRTAIPSDYNVRYKVANGPTYILHATWHLESIPTTADQERNLGYRLFKFVPYVREIFQESNGVRERSWLLNYGYPGSAQNCSYDWTKEKPADVVLYKEAQLAGAACQPAYAGHLIRGRYTGPLFLKSVQYPDANSGAASGPTRRFDYDARGRMQTVYAFDGHASTSVRYEESNNRVVEQYLGALGVGTPIRYSVVDNNFRRELQGKSSSFTGYEVEILTRANRRAILGINVDGNIEYLREWFDRGPMQQTFYAHNVVGLTAGITTAVYHPNNITESFTYQDQRTHYSHWPLTEGETRAIQMDKFLSSFRLVEKGYLTAGNASRQTWSYTYHPNSSKGFHLIQTATDPLARVTNIQYDFEGQNRCSTKLGLPARITYPDQSTEQIEYNNLGQPLFNRSRLGAETNFSYYGTGNGCGQ